MLAALLDLDPDTRPVGPAAPWVPEVVPSDRELLARTLRTYAMRPEKVVRQSIRAVRELADASGSGGLRMLADVISRPLPGPAGTMVRARLAATARHDPDRPPALPTSAAPRTPWNRTISPHRRFAFA